MRISEELREVESDGELPGPFHAQSYNDLLKFPDVPVSTIDTPYGKRAITEPLVDAIVVPTIRSAEHLRTAVQLAVNARCHVIVVYTDNPPVGFSDVLGKLPQDQLTLLTVRSGTRDRRLDLGAYLPQSLTSPSAVDISRKRNLGLLIGRMCGWTRMLFLDDDIRKLNVAKLSSAAAQLDDYPVVGLQVNKYPDASVVGHARRLTGRRQEPFVSGGSLLVNPQLLNGYFAPVYHEDWLCVINHLRKGEVAIGGSVGQLPYLPFTTLERAKFEEFGDILLSGLLWLVRASTWKGATDKTRSVAESIYWQEAVNPRFWEHILEQRAELLQEIDLRLRMQNLENPSALSSLAAARQRLVELEPDDFVSFMKEWLISLGVWRSSLPLTDLPDKARAIEKALAKLGLADVVRVHEPSSIQQGLSNGTRWIGGFADRWNRRTGADGRRRFGAERALAAISGSWRGLARR